MKHPQQIARRTAALLLCVVLLSAFILPGIIPQARAIDEYDAEFEEIIVELVSNITESDIRQLSQVADIYVGLGIIGAAAATTGTYTEIQIINFKMLEAVLKKKAATAAQATGINWSAVGTTALKCVIGALAAAGVTVVAMTDWRMVLEYEGAAMASGRWDLEDAEAWLAQNVYKTGNMFYDWSANWSWSITKLMNWLDGDVYDASNRKEKAARYWELTQSGWETINSSIKNLFGGNKAPGPQELPALTPQQVLEIIHYAKETDISNFGGIPYNATELYRIPRGVTYEGRNGQFLRIYDSGNRILMDRKGVLNYTDLLNGKFIQDIGYDVGNSNLEMMSWIIKIPDGTIVGDYPAEYTWLISAGHRHKVTGFTHAGTFGAYIMATDSDLGLPAVPIVNNAGAVADAMPDDRGLYIPVPAIPATDTGEIDWPGYLGGLKTYNPTKAIEDTLTGEGEAEKEGEKEKDKEAEKEDAKSLELPMEMEGFRLNTPDVTRKFPFSVPFTLIACISLLNAKAEEPIFEIPFVIPLIGFEHSITIDLTEFETVFEIIRWFLTLSYIFGLAMITRNVIRG